MNNEQSSATRNNGLTKKYLSSSRTFSRPYSAKTVFFYKEGDVYFTGVRVPVSKHRYKTFDSLLEELNHQIYMPFGVRNITTPKGNSTISQLDQLEHLGKYVASSSKPPRGIDFETVEKLRLKMSAAFRAQRTGGQAFWVPTTPSSTQKIRMSRMLGFNIISAKQVFFVLNGKGRFFRMVINPNKIPTMDQLLEEISAGLQVAIYRLYSPDGQRISTVEDILSINSPKIIACPRNERPFLQTSIALPEIKPSHYAPRPHYTKQSVGSSSLTSGSSSSVSNSVEKTPKIPPINPVVKKSTVLAAQNRKNRLRKQLNLEPKKDITTSGGGLVKKFRAERNLGRYRPANVTGTIRQKASTQNSSETSEATSGTSGSSANTGGMTRRNHTTTTSSGGKLDDLLTGESSFILEEDGEDGIGLSDSSDHDQLQDTREGSRASDEVRGGTAKSRESSRAQSSHPSTHFSSDGEQSRVSTQQSHTQNVEPGTPAVHTPDTTRGGTPKSIPATPNHQNHDHPGTPSVQTPDTTRIRTPMSTSATPNVHTPDTVRRGNDTPTVRTPSTSSSNSNKKNAAATVIQAAFRGHTTRKTLKEVPNLADPDLEQDDDEENPVKGKSKSESTSAEDKTTNTEQMTYTIEVKLGNRYGADTEADLFIFLHGDDQSSGKIHINQEEDWLKTKHPKFGAGAVVRSHVTAAYLGTIVKVVVGHEKSGYGAGMFIERIKVTENKMDGRQFMFFVNKWFDSGQVDGKMQRTVYLSTFLYLLSKPIRKNAVTLGRWEFIIHTRKDEMGGTTSNLVIVGYGPDDFAMSYIENDRMLRDSNFNPLIQVDFGEDIGQLQKVRFEIDGAGDQPNYFIEYVEVRDLDTDERSAVSVNNWLIAQPDEEMKKFQPFREIPIYRKAEDALSMTSYDGKVTLADVSLCLEEEPEIKLQLIGPNAQSGIFPALLMKNTSAGKIFTFKIDMVTLGSIAEVRIIPKITDLGTDILDGFNLLQEIYENQSIRLPVANDLFVNDISIRETHHAPFRHIFGYSTVKYEENNENGPFFKTLKVKVVEGLMTTKKPSKDEKNMAKKEKHYIILMSAEDPETLEIPFIILCSSSGICQQMESPESVSDTGIFKYELKTLDIDHVEKIRIGVNEIGKEKTSFVNKMRLVETISKTEVRLTLNAELRDYEQLEMMCAYPDIAPKYSLVYLVYFKTVKSKGNFRPYINVSGTDGDTGFRAFPGMTEFPDNTTVQMEVEALQLGTLKSVQLKCVTDQKIQWKCSVEIVGNDRVVYATNEIVIKKAMSVVETELVQTERFDIEEGYELGEDVV